MSFKLFTSSSRVTVNFLINNTEGKLWSSKCIVICNMAKRSGNASFADAKHGKNITCHVIPNFYTILRTENKMIHHFLRRLKLIEGTLSEAIFSVVPHDFFFSFRHGFKRKPSTMQRVCISATVCLCNAINEVKNAIRFLSCNRILWIISLW